jgi:glutaredoxin 3
VSAKEFLAQNNISYLAKDVNTDMTAQSEFIKHNLSGVPAFLIGDDVVVGLNKERILALVDHRTVTCPGCKANIRVPLTKDKKQMQCPKCKTIIE